MIKVSKARSGTATVTFAIPADLHDGPVSVVGDFNGWTPGATPLVRRWNGTRSAKISVPPGRFEFRYLGAGGAWLDEPEAPERAGDNSVLVVA